MTLLEPVSLQPVWAFADVPEGLALASYVVDDRLEPVITFHSKRPAPYTAQPALYVWHGWPPTPAAQLDNPGAVHPIVQSLGKEWLVVDSLARSGSASAWLVAESGLVKTSANFRHAVEDVQVDEQHRVWVSRFDEASDNMLEIFRLDGTCVSDFSLGISDCYAMNVVSSREAWVCYYTDFPLAVILDGEPVTVLAEAPVAGSHALAVAGDLVLFAPGYDEEHLSLVDTASGDIVRTYLPVTPDGQPIGRVQSRGRGNRMFLLNDVGLMGVEVRDREPYVVPLELPPTSPAGSMPGT